MEVFVTGGTGFIGSAIVNALHRAGHTTLTLARSDQAALKSRQLGSRPVRGDMREPKLWISQIANIDAAIHTASTYADDIASSDSILIESVVRVLARRRKPAPSGCSLVYTGGAWLYGPVAEQTAVEGSLFNAPPEFEFMVEQRRRLFASNAISSCVVHPAMVWDVEGGVTRDFEADAKAGRSPRVAGSLTSRWPMVYRADLAELYVKALESGMHGADYHGVAERGVRVGLIAEMISRRHSAPEPIVETIESVVSRLGSWAASRAYDQTMDAPLTRKTLKWNSVHPGILTTG